MQSSKLIILFKSLSPEEFRRFQKFLNSPFYNYSKTLTVFYEYLKKYYPDFNSPKLKKEKVWKKLFPNEDFDEAKYWRLTSKLSLLVEKFMAVLELEKSPRQERKLVAESFGKRDLNQLYEKEINNLIDKKYEYDNDPGMHPDKLILLEKLYDFLKNIRSDKAGEIPEKLLFELDSFYFQERIKLSGSLKSSEIFLRKKYNSTISNYILKTINDNPEYQIPSLIAFSNLYKFLEDRDIDSYWSLKNSLFESLDIIGINNQKFIYKHLINYAIGRVNKGDQSFRLENFELYKIGIEKKWLLDKGELSEITFTNIAAFGASLNQFAWTQKFIGLYNKYVTKVQRETAKTLGTAYLNFYQEKFEGVIDLLLPQKFESKLNLLRSKSLLLRSYFELMLKDDSFYDLFNSYSKSYEKFLRRDNILSESKIEFYINFILLLRRVANLKIGLRFNENEKNNIVNRIKKEKLILKDWIIEKVQSM